jgi:hypothetical protein
LSLYPVCCSSRKSRTHGAPSSMKAFHWKARERWAVTALRKRLGNVSNSVVSQMINVFPFGWWRQALAVWSASYMYIGDLRNGVIAQSRLIERDLRYTAEKVSAAWSTISLSPRR